MSNYHDRVMNIQFPEDLRVWGITDSGGVHRAYKLGHLDARHAAAEIAAEADIVTDKLATALEEIVNAGFWYPSALEIDEHRKTPDGSPPKDGEALLSQARYALKAYYGGTEHGD